eukprot:IDg7852t1
MLCNAGGGQESVGLVCVHIEMAEDAIRMQRDIDTPPEHKVARHGRDEVYNPLDRSMQCTSGGGRGSTHREAILDAVRMKR